MLMAALCSAACLVVSSNPYRVLLDTARAVLGEIFIFTPVSTVEKIQYIMDV